jgi:hypothetical protein
VPDAAWHLRAREAASSRLLSFLLMAAGCSGSEAGPDPIAQIDTVGTRIEVTNTGRPMWTAEGRWRLEEDLRLGTAAAHGPAAEQFGHIQSVATDSRGRIYVLEGMAQEIRVFDSTGVYLHTIGRRGHGPGEFSGASELDLGPGDTLRVLDDGLMRFSVFAPDGTFAGNHRREIVGTGAPRRSTLHDGGYLDWMPAFPEGRFGARVRFYPVRYGAGFERADTFPPVEYTRPMVPSGGPLMNFGGSLVASVDGGGSLWFAHSREYRIYRRSLEGDTALVFSLPVDAVPVVESDRDYVRNRWRGRPEIVSEQLEALPETRPVVYGVVPDNAGHILVFADVAGEARGTVLDVFRESGEYLGRTRLPTPVPLSPDRPPVVHVSPEYLHVVVEDQLAVPYVSRIAVTKGDGQRVSVWRRS